MPVWDAIVEGAPKLDSSHFGVGFYEDWIDYDVNQSNGPGATDGKWRRGFYLDQMPPGGNADWGGSFFGHTAVNNERQHYGSQRYRHPDGYEGIHVQDGILVMQSRPVDKRNFRDMDRCRINGVYGQLDSAGNSYSALNNHLAAYYGESLTTHHRYSQSFGEFEARLRMPYGAYLDPSDVLQRKCVFPAWWLLQAIPVGRDINGDQTADGSTWMPAKFHAGNIVTEIDILEGFGYDAYQAHQTLHYYLENSSGPNDGAWQDARTVFLDFDMWRDWFTAGVHVTPGKIGMFINGIYTYVIDTPPEIGDGMRLAVPDPLSPGKPASFTSGYQLHPDGNKRYMQFFMLLNVARDSSLGVLSGKQYSLDAGYMPPPHQDTVTMYVDWVQAKPLITDNPDTYGIMVRDKYFQTHSGGWAANES